MRSFAQAIHKKKEIKTMNIDPSMIAAACVYFAANTILLLLLSHDRKTMSRPLKAVIILLGWPLLIIGIIGAIAEEVLRP
jgi:uncharacterized membrane protein YgdD (TMEM256/DUF423 family)